jgi:molybdopterin-guanine dinucleotide biosynthesis protein A
MEVARSTDPAPDVAGYVLAGGKSTRMGTDKASLTIDGESLVARVVRIVASVATPVVVVGHPGLHRAFGLDVIPDASKDLAGANVDYMNGVVTALQHSSAPWTLIVSADMPYLTSSWLRYMVDRGRNADVDLTTRGFCNLYRTASLPAVIRALNEDPRHFGDTMKYLRYLVLKPEDSAAYDPDGWLFLDVDTPEELAAARLRLSRTDGR